ncbi:MAG: Gfo/Idh/MocA family oxidoreductase [Bacteroidota bacterium]
MRRREFMVKSGLVSAAVVTSSTTMGHALSNNSANETVRIGVIGTGARGSGLIPLIAQIPNFEVVACCDILPFRLENGLAKTKSKAKGYSDYRKLLEHPDLDAVLVATPFSSHSKIAMDALDADKHVYCEKTMAKGFEGIRNLVNKAKSSNTIFQTGHQYHSSRLYTYIVEMIKAGEIGNIAAFECQWNRNGNWRRAVSDPKLERLINWRMYREFSGGLAAELSSHQIDFANWVLDETPEKVMGMGGVDYWKDGRETYDNIHLLYSYPSGVKAKFTCLTSNAMDDYKIKVHGDQGTVILDYVRAWFYPEGKTNKQTGNVDGVAGATLSWDEGKGYPIQVDHEDPSKQALRDFRNNIVGRKAPLSDVLTGAKASICVQMGLDAMYNEKIVNWPSNYGDDL